MPPGYAAFFMWAASAVLWWSGWREETAQGIPDRAVAVFLAGWPIAASRTVHAGDAVVGGAFVWAGLAAFALIWSLPAAARRTACSAGILAGSFVVLLSGFQGLCPDFPDWAAQLALPTAAGICSSLLVRGASGQIVALTLAMTMLETLPAVWPGAGDAGVVIGSGRWRECWWISVLCARLFTVLASKVRIRIGMPAWRREGEGS